MSLIKSLGAILNKVIDLLAAGGVVVLAGAMLLVTVSVITRYLLARPLENVIDITEHSLVCITFLAAAWVLKREQHVKMDTVLNRLSPTRQTMVNFITSILGALICLILFWYGFRSTWDYFQRGLVFSEGTMVIPQAPILAVIVVGYFMLFVQFLRRSYRFLREWQALRS